MNFSLLMPESLLVIQQMGVQFQSVDVLGRQNCSFIAHSDITDVIINEAVTFSDVFYYVSFLIKGKNHMVLAFREIRPRLEVSLKVYHGTLSILSGEKEAGESVPLKLWRKRQKLWRKSAGMNS